MSILRPVPRHYDEACPHEFAHRALSQAMEETGLNERLVGVSGSGCSALIHGYFDLPFVAAPSGRGPTVARGILHSLPDKLPFVYAGEAELVGEGLSDLLRAASLNVPILVVSIAGLGQAPGSCAQGNGWAFATAELNPVKLLSPLQRFVETVETSDLTGAVRAFSRGLEKAANEQSFAFVQVHGTCPAIGRED